MSVFERALEPVRAEPAPGLILGLADRKDLGDRDRRRSDVERQVNSPGGRRFDVHVGQPTRQLAGVERTDDVAYHRARLRKELRRGEMKSEVRQDLAADL